MQIINFFKISLSVMILVIITSTHLLSTDFRKTKPKAWDILNDLNDSNVSKAINLKGTDKAIKAIFGTNKITQGGIELKTPKIVENGAVIPINVSTKLKAKTIAIFQSSNPQSLVAVFDVVQRSIPDYILRIRLQDTAILTAVVQTVDGKLYKTSKIITVVVGGCGG